MSLVIRSWGVGVGVGVGGSSGSTRRSRNGSGSRSGKEQESHIAVNGVIVGDDDSTMFIRSRNLAPASSVSCCPATRGCRLYNVN